MESRIKNSPTIKIKSNSRNMGPAQSPIVGPLIKDQNPEMQRRQKNSKPMEVNGNRHHESELDKLRPKCSNPRPEKESQGRNSRDAPYIYVVVIACSHEGANYIPLLSFEQPD